jgi:hypothetical protein
MSPQERQQFRHDMQGDMPAADVAEKAAKPAK